MIGRKNRKIISENQRTKFTRIINGKIYSEINNLKNIMIYNAVDGEVEIFKKDNFDYIYPKIIDDKIVPYQGEDFIIGKYNILEPTGNIYCGKIDAIIVPMCAFDNNFNRLGFGKGYYDKFLSVVDTLKIGVAFDCQKAPKIQEKDTDVKMDIIITENEVLKRRQNV